MALVTEAELLDALRTAMHSVPDKGGSTSAELSDALGWSHDRTRTAVKRLLASGQMETLKGWRTAMDGRRGIVPVYRFVKKPKR